MLRLIAIFILFLSVGAVVMAGLRLQKTLSFSRQTTEALAPRTFQREDVDIEDAASPRLFPPIFGEPALEKPIMALSPKPGEIEFKYSLKGVIVSSEMRWAILGSPTGDVLLREGEVIDGATLAKIHADSIDVELGTDLLNLTFSNKARVEVAMIDTLIQPSDEGFPITAADVWDPEGQAVMFQGVSREDLARLLRNAESRRRRQGWIP